MGEGDVAEASCLTVQPASEAPPRAEALAVADAVADRGVVAEPVLIAQLAYQTSVGKWSSGLFDCRADLPICCYVAWCYHCAFGHVMAANLGSKWRDECCSIILWDVCNGCFGPYYHAIKRAKIRAKYGDLPEEPCDDCTTVCFCGPCALCQEARHAKAANPNTISCLGM
ncbi:hypothetical protein CTAYLR_006995 [Chrysophaeum taylorii]|uniref:Uncharacterized protein n=1 Tax=Chrysophaeum taylorii TaxID=2483200 RepID=A0AAD7UBX9_9STRA|nr:hypothetical protein CTAYLR_006995 [Chrysophaeum taylorii]